MKWHGGRNRTRPSMTKWSATNGPPRMLVAGQSPVADLVALRDLIIDAPRRDKLIIRCRVCDDVIGFIVDHERGPVLLDLQQWHEPPPVPGSMFVDVGQQCSGIAFLSEPTALGHRFTLTDRSHGTLSLTGEQLLERFRRGDSSLRVSSPATYMG